jgi:hypothetical protein
MHRYGPGPFEIVRIVDKAELGISLGVVRTKLGDRDINEVWLVFDDDSCNTVEYVG